MLDAESQLTANNESEFVAWNPEGCIEQVDTATLRFSNGFLCCDIAGCFRDLMAHWKLLIHSLNLDFYEAEAVLSLDFPGNMERVVPIEIEGEMGVIGIDRDTRQSIVDAVSGFCSSDGEQIILEYFERRLISSLCMSQIFKQKVLIVYGNGDIEHTVDIAGAIGLKFQLSGIPCQIWFGLGSKAVEQIDLYWRGLLAEKPALGSSQNGAKNYVSIELAALAVPPTTLIDYVKEGAIVDLQYPLADRVKLRLNAEDWAIGRLLNSEGKFAVEVLELNVERNVWPEATTLVQFEFGSLTLSDKGLKEVAQVGALLKTDIPLSSKAGMIISGENVGDVEIGQVGENFAARILPK